jgi:AcrR family transcriptional regulator
MSDERLRAVEQACIDLVQSGEAVTLDTVATRAGIGRATIYRHPELHAVVNEHRQRASEALTLSSLAVQIDQLRVGLEALAAKVRRHDETLRRLKSPTKKIS